jgi:predicted TIM-barrel fold metal-dependent hydrolase
MIVLENRRQFLKKATAITLAGIGSEIATAEEKNKMLPIIDTHQHLWDLKKFRLPWIKPGTILANNHLMSDYLKATEGLNVVKTIYMEVDLDPAQQQAEAEFVIETCKRGGTPMVAGVISGRPNEEGFAKYITPFKDNPYIKGVRQILHSASTPPGYCLDEKFIKGIRLLGELGLSFDLCMRPNELGDGAKLVDSCPGTRFILDHCGNGDVQAKDLSGWQSGMTELSKQKNVVACKVSGIVVSAKPEKWTADDLAPVVNYALDAFGPERVMFGGDWPVCTLTATYKQWLEALKVIVKNRSEKDQRKLFHDNAVRVYGLK